MVVYWTVHCGRNTFKRSRKNHLWILNEQIDLMHCQWLVTSSSLPHCSRRLKLLEFYNNEQNLMPVCLFLFKQSTTVSKIKCEEYSCTKMRFLMCLLWTVHSYIFASPTLFYRWWFWAVYLWITMTPFFTLKNIPAACKMKCWNLRHDANLKTE